MEGLDLQQRLRTWLKKYRSVLIVVLAGVLLMTLPEGRAKSNGAVPPEVSDRLPLEERLTELLSTMEGAGKVQVLLTEAKGPRTIYQCDREQQEDSLSEKTVLVRDSGRGEAGLIRNVDPPVYLGAVILCQGGDRASVRLSVVKAVSSATGLGADKITVLKMK